jgi:hypothetical protein
MQPTRDEQDEEPGALLFLQDLGAAIRLSFEARLDDPLPAEMGLLLMRLALVEVLKDATEQEAKAEPESLPEGWVKAFQQSLELNPCLRTWWRWRYRAAG